jgi:hypothetical protein
VPAPNSKQKKQSPSPNDLDYDYDYHKRMPHGQTRFITFRLSQTPIVAAENQGILARDMAELPHLHEAAAILYQVKERHVLENRIRAWVNCGGYCPCQWIEGLTFEGGTRKVRQDIGLARRYVTLYCTVGILYCVTGREAASSRLKSNYSQHEFPSIDILGAGEEKKDDSTNEPINGLCQ